MSALCPLNHAIAAFATANVAIVSNSIKAASRRTSAHPTSAASRLWAAAGAPLSARGGELEDGEKAEPPRDRTNGGKRKRRSGGGVGGGGEHSPPARANRCRRGEGSKHQPPPKAISFPQPFAAPPYQIRPQSPINRTLIIIAQCRNSYIIQHIQHVREVVRL